VLRSLAAHRIGLIDRIAGLIADPRAPDLVTLSVASRMALCSAGLF